MQKLRRVVLDNMISAGLTGLQVDMMLYLSQYQDEYGRITGVYYRAVCKETGMSIQSFYNVLRSLQEKQLISMVKNDRTDWDIQILNNDCHDFGNRRKLIGQYLNTNQSMLFCEPFRSLSGNAKMLAMFLLRRCGENSHNKKYAAGFRQKPEGFFKALMEMLHVSKRVILSYLKDLEPLFSLGTMIDEHSGSELYCVRPKASGLKKGGQSENQKAAEHRVRAFCRRRKLDPADDASISDTAKLATQYGQPMAILEDAIIKAIEVAGHHKLLPGAALVHKVLRGMLGLEAPMHLATIE